MMQKYSPISDDEPNMQEDSEHGTYYWCAEVDARMTEMRKAFETSSTDEENKLRARVAELESALREATLCDDCGCACRKVCVNQGCDTL